MQSVLSLILGGGRGKQLYPLTKHRSEPAVSFAGKYRLIDIPISNCLNSEVKRVYVLTQFLSASLNSHIVNTYKTDAFTQGFIEVLAAEQTYDNFDWFAGTADAIRQHLHYVEHDGAKLILILSADQLYRMNYRDLVETHRRQKADVTMSLTPVTAEDAVRFGIVRLDKQGRIIEMVEKPKESQLESLRVDESWLSQQGIQNKNRCYLANMGIYLFKRNTLIGGLNNEPDANDLVRDLFPGFIQEQKVVGHLFKGYWRDVGTISSYHQANLEMTSVNPAFYFHNEDGIIFTRMRNLPAAQVMDSYVEECLLCDGITMKEGCTVKRSVIGIRSRIGKNVQVTNSVVIGATHVETQEDLDVNRVSHHPDMGIGDDCVIQNAILDKDCRIGNGVRIINEKNLKEADAENYIIRDGIVVIPRDAIIPDGSVI